MLSVLLLGQPQVLRDGQALAIPRRRGRALLYYLAAQPAPVSREHLLARFWPDHQRADAQHQLRTMLYTLRGALGEALRTGDQLVGLADDVDVDLRDLEAAVGAATPSLDRLAAACERYRGDLLDSFALDDAPSFAHWLDAERERCCRLACRGFVRLSELYAAGGQFRRALAAVDRALALDPLQEDVQRAGMRLAYLAGDRVGAIRRFEQLRRLLDDELGVPPLDDTRALYDAIVTDTLARPAAPPAERTMRAAPDTLPFVGRGAELAAIGEAMSAGRLALVEGPAGSGKTRLVEHALAGAGRLALRGAAHELEQALPYQPVIAALRRLLADPGWPALAASLALAPFWWRELARLLPELDPAASQAAPADESRLWEGLAQLLVGLAALRPVALVLDDLQWADQRTLMMLGYIVRRCAECAPAIAMLATSRPLDPATPAGQVVAALLREELLTPIPLARLSAAEVGLMAARLADDSAPLAAWLASRSEGAPFVLAELVRELRARGLLDRERRFTPPPEAGPIVPASVASLVRARLAQVSAPARRLLDVAAVAGRQLAAELALAAGLAEAEAADAFDELAAADLLRPTTEPGYAFDHQLTGEVVLQELGPARRRLLHRQVAEALERASAPPDGLIAAHFAAAGLADRAAPYADRAGQRAASLAAWDEAVDFFQRALAASAAERKPPISLRMGQAYYAAGRYAEACAALEQAAAGALAQADDDLLDQVRLALGRAMLPQARYDEAIALARQVQADHRPLAALAAELLLGTALAQQGYDLARAQQHLERAAGQLEQQLPLDRDGLVMAVFELGGVAAQQGQLPRAVEAYRRALALALQGGFAAADQWTVIAYNNLAYHLHLLGDETARQVAAAGLALARAQGIAGLQTYLHSTLGEIALAAGDLDTADQHVGAGLELAEQRGLAERIAGLTALGGRVAARRGDATGARGQLAAALQLAEQGGYRHLAAQIRLWLAPLLSSDEARAQLAAVRQFARASGRRLLLAEAERLMAALG